MTTSIVLEGLPIPPSINNCYVNIRPGMRFASKELKQFKKDCEIWALRHQKIVSRAIDALCDANFLKVDYLYTLRYSRIFTKAGAAKRFDVSNRIKNIEDAIFSMLQIDDCHAFEISAKKRSTENEDEECVKVTITVI